MSKSPEEYFQEQNLVPESEPGTCFSEAELAFMRKYMGIDAPGALSGLGLDVPAALLNNTEATSLSADIKADLADENNIAETMASAAPVEAKQQPEETETADQLLEPGDAEMLAMASEYADVAEDDPAKPMVAPLHDEVSGTGSVAVGSPAPASPMSQVREDYSGQDSNTSIKHNTVKYEQASLVKSESDGVEPATDVPSSPPADVQEATPVVDNFAPEQSTVPTKIPPSDLYGEMSAEEPLERILRNEEQVQMVGFFLGKQEFTVPTLAVQEVIRYETPAKMPAAPEFVAGVINLRGKMTPLIHLRDMLEVKQARETEDRFIIVCRRKGLQVGLIIERVHTMYRVPQTDIDWGIESLLGINNAEFLSGLLKLNENLVGVVSVDRLVDYILE